MFKPLTVKDIRSWEDNPKFDDLIIDPKVPFSFITFCDAIHEYLMMFPGMRYGQAVYNLVDSVSPSFNDYMLDFHQYDPFWDDTKVPAYLLKAFEFGIFY